MDDRKPTGEKDIFLSYDREEAVQAFVVKLKRDLEKNGFTAFLDVDDVPQGTQLP